VLHAARSKYRTQKSPSVHHPTTSSHITLMAEISLGQPSKFQRVSRLAFVTAATSLTRGQPMNQTLHDVWPSPGLVAWYTIYTFSGALAPRQNFVRWKIHFTSKSCLLLYWQRYCTSLQQRASVKLCGVVQRMELSNVRRGRHLYSAGRTSRWASAHILVI